MGERLTYNGTRTLLARCPWAERLADHPERYAPEKGLMHAISVALTLEKPLLVTGEPGTGKTQLAYHLAWALGLEEPLKFEATSTMQAKDLFYTFDTVGRFHAAQDKNASSDALAFVSLQALGQALVRSLDDPAMLPFSIQDRHDTEVSGQRSVVLVDEIDKAPRDVPNDLLNEIEHLYFRIPECGGVEIRGNPGQKPILVFTSNSERFLPDAFLRRCIFYDIPYPSQAQLETIVQRHLILAGERVPKLVRDCISLIDFLRSAEAGLARKPGPAELLDWLRVLALHDHDLDQPFLAEDETLIATACTLIKNRGDQSMLDELIGQWRGARPLAE